MSPSSDLIKKGLFDQKKNVMLLKIINEDIFWKKKIFPGKIFPGKIFEKKKFSWESFWKKNFSRENFSEKKFFPGKIFGKKKIFPGKIFGKKKFFPGKFLEKKNFPGKFSKKNFSWKNLYIFYSIYIYILYIIFQNREKTCLHISISCGEFFVYIIVHLIQ